MRDLILQIENLMPEHDCVVVPGLGGFVQNETEAKIIHVKETFYPGRKEISFNARLSFNDGILVQSYQESYNLSFEDATERLKKDVALLKEKLEEGKFIRLGRIGSMHKTVDGNIMFHPDNRNLFYPESYGLSPFVYNNLEHRMHKPEKTLTETPERKTVKKVKHEPYINIRLPKRALQNFLTGAVASLFILLLSKPVGGLEGVENQKAFLLQEYFEELPTTTTAKPVKQIMPNAVNAAEEIQTSTIKSEAATVAIPEQKVETSTIQANATPIKKQLKAVQQAPAKVIEAPVTKQEVVTAKPVSLRTYYIIISSCPERSIAENWLKTNKKGIYSNSGIIERDGRSRIYIRQFSQRDEADQWLETFKSNHPDHNDAWLLSVKN
jgi:hypothetical protein